MTQTRWLDVDEQLAWRRYLEAGQLLMDTLDRELHRDSGLSHADYEILARLSEARDRRMRMSELADLALFSRSRLSHAVSRLERRGWVERRPCPDDRRGTLALLTDAGLATLAEAAHRHVTGVREHLLDQLSREELLELGRMSAAVAEHLRAVEHRRPA